MTPTVDAHVHVWRPTPDYPEPGATIVSPLSAIPPTLLSGYMDEHGVDRAVLVQPMYPGEDNSYVADCAAAEPGRFAAVCVVDPRQPDAADRLEYWVQERGCRGLRLRPRIAAEAENFGQPATWPLWERARDLGVAVNLLCELEHLPAVAALAERFPEVPILIDHMAHPSAAEGAQAPAFQRLLDLAQTPNVLVKVSGHYYYSGEAYPYADCTGFVSALYDHFGPARLVWGSDFPHVLLKCGYGRCLRLPERAYPFFSAAERELLLGGNVARLYWGDEAQ